MAKVSKRTWTYKGETKTAYIVRYFDAGGARRQETFEKRKDADARRQKIEAELADDTHVAAGATTTVAGCCKAFLENAERRRAAGQIGESRYRIFGWAVRNHIVPHLGAKKLTELRWADLEDWQKKLDHLGPRTRDAYLVVFKMVEDHAIKRGLLKKPIVREFRRDVGYARVEPIKTFTAEQASALLRTVVDRPKGMVRRSHEMMVCAVYLAACCGLRWGEITGLTLGALDFDRNVIRVRHNLTEWDLLKGPKTSAGKRDVPMPVRIAELLKAYVASNYIPNERELVFRTRTGEQIKSPNFRQRQWYPLCKRVGLSEDGTGYHFHALRHFAASWMIEHGLALPDVASLMGHAKFDMTLQVYAHPIVGGHRRHEAFERMTGSLVATAQPQVAAPSRELVPQG